MHDNFPIFIYILENRTAFHATLKKEFSIFFYFTLDETNKKNELIFFKDEAAL